MFSFLVAPSALIVVTHTLRDFPGGSDGKASAYNVGDLGSIPGSARSPGEGNGNPLQCSLPGKSHGRRNLVGYSPWGRKESDTTEQLHFYTLRQMIPKFVFTAVSYLPSLALHF